VAVAPEDLERILETAVQPPDTSIPVSRPPVLDGLANMRYSLALQSPADGKLLHVPYTALSFEQQDGEVATRVSATIPDVDSDVGPLWELCKMGTPLWLMGGQERLVEIFRGQIMEVGDRTSHGGSFGVLAYDAMHNALRSKYDLYFGGPATITDIINAYKAKASFETGYIEEPGVKLGSPGYIIRQKTMIDGITDALREVLSKGGAALKLRVMRNKLELVRPANNPVIYHFRTGGVAIQSTIHGSIADMVGSVVVMGHGADEDKLPVLKTRSSDAGFTGAVEMVYSQEADSDQATQLEVDSILAEKGFPNWKYSHTAFAVPGIYKWERVHITDGIVDDHFIVSGLSMDLVAKTMQMTLMTTEQLARETRQIQLQAALDKLKAESSASSDTKSGTGKSSHTGTQKLLDIVAPVMGLAYVLGGAGGRSDFSKDMHHVGTDCSGFVSWMTHQLGSSTGTTTDAIAAASTLVPGGTDQAAPGDYILYWDGGASDPGGLKYPHVAMYLGNGQVLESGGSVVPSSIGKGTILPGYPRIEVRRNQAVYNTLNAEPTKAAGSSKVTVGV
jgi:cell wall-associated NlpC family hydrolase